MKDRFRVLSLSTVYPTSVEPGRGLFVRSRLTALARRVDLEIVAPVGLVRWGAAPEGFRRTPIRARRVDDGVVVHHPYWLYPPSASAINGLLLALRLLPHLARLRRTFPWDVLDAHYAHPEGVAAALCARAFQTPYVVTLRGAEIEHARSSARVAAMRASLRGAARVIALSHELQALAVSLGAREDRVRVVPNGVDAALFSPMPRVDARACLGLPHTGRIVLAAGRLVAGKAHHIVVEAVRALMSEHPDLRLFVAGGSGREGPAYERALRAALDEPALRGRVELLGHVPQERLATWMNAADVFCLGSLREGSPNVVLEALACGAPVVATRVGTVPEIVNEERGVVVPPGDASALSRALEHALSRSWDRGAIAAAARARCWPTVAAECAAVLHEALAELGGRD
jgi:glycosyltransferase involved in cell wall biosynthesis